MIRKQGRFYVVLDSTGRKTLGKHKKKSDALKQLRAIEINKKRKKR